MFYLMLLIFVLENKILICSRMKKVYEVFYCKDFDLGRKKILCILNF